jgi:transcription initiation factor TFIIIB Brf1 subunit/transcription initiation factor TFIIB
VVYLLFLHLETCEEDEGKFVCQQCDSIFCEKCFDVSHRSEKKKLHEKKEMDDVFVSQKCPKHENKKLDLFCVKDKVKICSLCLDDHQSHEVITIKKAIAIIKTEIQNTNFKEIMEKKKELSDLEVKKLLKIDNLESIQKISNSIKREKDFDKILEWRFFGR